MMSNECLYFMNYFAQMGRNLCQFLTKSETYNLLNNYKWKLRFYIDDNELLYVVFRYEDRNNPDNFKYEDTLIVENKYGHKINLSRVYLDVSYSNAYLINLCQGILL